MREASDGREFLASGEKALGVPIQLLSGEREAQLAALGITMGFGEADGVAGDLGGGSLELVDLAGDVRRNGVTLPLGGLRLIDVTGDRIDKALDVTDEQLAKVAWAAARPRPAVLCRRRHLARARQAAHGAGRLSAARACRAIRCEPREAIQFCEALRKGKLARCAASTMIAQPRREVLPYGALVLERLLERLRAVAGRVLRVRHPRGHALRPAGPGRAPQGPAA